MLKRKTAQMQEIATIHGVYQPSTCDGVYTRAGSKGVTLAMHHIDQWNSNVPLGSTCDCDTAVHIFCDYTVSFFIR
jgi:hypothetical protein